MIKSASISPLSTRIFLSVMLLALLVSPVSVLTNSASAATKKKSGSFSATVTTTIKPAHKPAATPAPKPAPAPAAQPKAAAQAAPKQAAQKKKTTNVSINGGNSHAVKSQSNTHKQYSGGARHFVDYDQNYTDNGGARWGSRIASAGCGPTSAAMVISTLTDKHVTPSEMGGILAPKYFINGSGTTAAAFPYLGHRFNHIKVKHVNGFGDVNRSLRDGGLVIVHAKPGHFTSAGHYMVIRWVNQNNRYTLADPNNAPGRDSEKKTWTADQLRANDIDDIWTFNSTEPVKVETNFSN